MNGALSGQHWGELAAVYLGLLLFGIGFNWAIGIAERRGWLRGYTSLAVALGVLVTIGATTLFSPLYALLTVGAFMSSGIPMIVGSIWRHVRERERELERLKEEASHDDEA